MFPEISPFHKSFFKQSARIVARDILGSYLIRVINGESLICKIVETEAYEGPEDRGCHAYNNLRTKRTEVMFHEGGVSYVYLIYGMYHCLNIVCSVKDKPEAVLIRAVEPVSGLKTIKYLRNIKSKKDIDLTNGPGKLCMALSIDRKLNGVDLISNKELYIVKGKMNDEILTSPRINIDYAKEYKDVHWRFFIKDNLYVSK